MGGVSIVKHLQDILTIPANCPACSTIAIEIEPDLGGGGFYLNKKRGAEKDDNKVQCYPNPTNSTFKVSIQSPCGKIETIDIYNITGKWLQTIPSGTDEVNIEQEPAGIYLCRVQTNTGEVLTGKIIKQ